MKIGRYSGFTLVELLVVVVIIAVLVTVAYPSYRDHILKAKRAEGRAALLKAGQLLERYYSDRNTYEWGNPGTGAVDVAPLFGLAAGAQVFSSENPTNPGSTGAAGTGDASYRIVPQAPTGGCPLNGCFEIRAVQQAPFVDADCGNLTLTSTGVRCWTTAGVPTTTCTPNPTNANRCKW